MKTVTSKSWPAMGDGAGDGDGDSAGGRLALAAKAGRRGTERSIVNTQKAADWSECPGQSRGLPHNQRTDPAHWARWSWPQRRCHPGLHVQTVAAKT